MANLTLFFKKLLKEEGGITVDTGGYTNKGITLDSWRTFGRDLNNDHVINEQDVKLISDAEAYSFYKKNYWDRIGGDQLASQDVAEIVFDHAVNAGVSRAIKMLQFILNKYFGAGLAVDGQLGSGTIAAANRANGSQLFGLYKSLRVLYYNYLADSSTVINSEIKDFFYSLNLRPNASTYGPYLKGWLARVNGFISGGSMPITAVVVTLLAAGTYWYFRNH